MNLKKYNIYQTLFILLIFILCICSCKAQGKQDISTEAISNKKLGMASHSGPNSIVRNIIQSKNGDIWIASFDGVFRYDGTSFFNMTKEISSARFFSILEDKQGNLWFGSIGSGVFKYDGKSFNIFTINDGLISNSIVHIFEDENGRLWFGCDGGVSLYDGKSFSNFSILNDTMVSNNNIIIEPNLKFSPMEVNSIIEDKNDHFWFATRGSIYIYNGLAFIIVKHDDEAFTNTRCLLKDKMGNIWIGGNDGLWTYDGTKFRRISENFVGYIYEDKMGNIWTSSEENPRGSWMLSRYDVKTFSGSIPLAKRIISGEGMIFGILEAQDGSIWYGTLKGVSRWYEHEIKEF